MSDFETARSLLKDFKGGDYLYGAGVLQSVGRIIAKAGKRAVLVRGTFPNSDDYVDIIRNSAADAGVVFGAEFKGVRPNAPREDLLRLADDLHSVDYDVLVSFGGGSTIDAAKAAEVLRTAGGEIDDYFGTGLVTGALERACKSLSPHVAIQSVASSAAHLSKYSNITDVTSGQKKLIVDDAIVPQYPLFDYSVNQGISVELVADGALDGVSHALEVLYGAVGKPTYEKVAAIAAACIRLVVNYLPRAIDDRADMLANEALCLATDLGGYAIMVGGTNGGHLTSFSLVDVLSHGRACAMMNPYYSVFFAPAIEAPLRLVGNIFQDAGYSNADFEKLDGRDLGVAVAEAMFSLAKKINFPVRLNEVAGLTDEHIERALTAAKNPQLKMKLENMPVPLNAEMINEYMKPVLLAAYSGDVSLIKNVV
jgi:alcohol dehydrogenase